MTVRERASSLGVSYKDTNPIGLGSHPYNSFNLGTSTYEFEGSAIQSIAIFLSDLMLSLSTLFTFLYLPVVPIIKCNGLFWIK